MALLGVTRIADVDGRFHPGRDIVDKRKPDEALPMRSAGEVTEEAGVEPTRRVTARLTGVADQVLHRGIGLKANPRRCKPRPVAGNSDQYEPSRAEYVN